MSVTVRPYRDEDRDAVRALVAAVLTEFGFGHAVGGVEGDLAEITARYSAEGAGFWVAVDGDGEVVGTVAIRPKEGRTCELKRLYDHAEGFARRAGYEAIWLDSSRRFGKAHRLYERNGFTLIERVDNDWEDNLYEKRLG